MTKTLTLRGSPIIQAETPEGERVYVTLGQADDWAAYRLTLPLLDVPLPHEILTMGIKVGKEEAVRLFPVMNPERYRR